MKPAHSLFLVLFSFCFGISTSEALTIDSVAYANPICQGKPASIVVYYSGTETYPVSNVFQVELSDSNFSFAQPQIIGTLNSTTNTGTITVSNFVLHGTDRDYGIRVVSTSLSLTSNIWLLNYVFKRKLTLSGQDPISRVEKELGFCANDSLYLRAWGGNEFKYHKWYENGVLMPEDLNSHNLARMIKQPGIYKVVDSGYCFQDSVTVIIPPPVPKPIAFITVTGNVQCLGEEGELHANAGAGFTYSWRRDTKMLPDTTIVIDPEFSGVYKLQVKAGPGCYTESADTFIQRNTGTEVEMVEQATGLVRKSFMRSVSVTPFSSWGIMADWAQQIAPVFQVMKKTNTSVWTGMNVPGASGMLPGQVSSVDSLRAWVSFFNASGYGGKVFATTNGGATWIQQCNTCFTSPKGFVNNVHFFNSTDGVLLGDYVGGCYEIYTTTNGGINWTRVPCGNINGTDSADGTVTNYTAIANSIWFPNQNGKIFRSVDKGQTWVQLSSPLFVVSSLAFRDPLNGFLLGYNTFPDMQTFRTSDGGTTWTKVEGKGLLMSGGIAYASNGLLFNYGAVNQISKKGISYSKDNGETWHIITSTTNKSVYCMDFSGLEGYAGGLNENATDGGALRITQDAFYISTSQNTTICEPDSIHISTPFVSGNTYQWMLNRKNIVGKTGTSVYANSEGRVQLKRYKAAGCPSVSNAIQINSAKPKPNHVMGAATVIPSSSHTYKITNRSGSLYHWGIKNGTMQSANGTDSLKVLWANITGQASLWMIETGSTNCVGDTNFFHVIIDSLINDTLQVNKQQLLFADTGGTQSVSVTANMNWKAINNQPSWISISPDSSSGNAIVQITVLPNAGPNSRMATISFQGNNRTQLISVIQDSVPFIDSLFMEKDSIIANKAGGNYTSALTSNRSWSVSGIPSWINVNKLSGTGNDTLTFVVSSNDSTVVRLATVTVTAGIAVENIIIMQDFNTGISEQQLYRKAFALKIYPNPASTQISVKGLLVNPAVLTDITGKYLMHIPSDGIYDISFFKPGLYFISSKDGTVKFIKE